MVMTEYFNRWVCLSCGELFPYNIDGCPNCGSQHIEDRENNI